MLTIGDLAKSIESTVLCIESPIENMLLNKLVRDPRFTLVRQGEPQGEGLFIYPQMQVGPYRADFIIVGIGYGDVVRVWPPNMLGVIAVECDGHEFHSHEVDVEHDRKRDEYFLSKGIKTIRFKGAQIYRNVSFCIDCIEHEIKQAMRAA